MTLSEAVRSGAFAKVFANRQWRYVHAVDALEWLDGLPQPSQAEIDAACVDPVPIDLSDVNNLSRSVKALALTFAQITGTPVAQVRTIFKQKWDSLG